MIDLDVKINSILKDMGIDRQDCIVNKDGYLLVSQTRTAITVVVETIVSFELLDKGNIRIESLFYFLSPINSDLDVLDDVNPKNYNIILSIIDFKKRLITIPYNTIFPTKKNYCMRYKTPAGETGIELLVTFDIPAPC